MILVEVVVKYSKCVSLPAAADWSVHGLGNTFKFAVSFQVSSSFHIFVSVYLHNFFAIQECVET